MEIKELRSKNIKELTNILQEQQTACEKLMNDVYKGKEKNISKSKFIRKDIARIKTLITEKKILEDKEGN